MARRNTGARYATGDSAAMQASLVRAGLRPEHTADFGNLEDVFMFRKGNRWGAVVVAGHGPVRAEVFDDDTDTSAHKRFDDDDPLRPDIIARWVKAKLTAARRKNRR